MLRMPFVTNMLKFREIVHCKLGMGSSVKILHKAGGGYWGEEGKDSISIFF